MHPARAKELAVTLAKTAAARQTVTPGDAEGGNGGCCGRSGRGGRGGSAEGGSGGTGGVREWRPKLNYATLRAPLSTLRRLSLLGSFGQESFGQQGDAGSGEHFGEIAAFAAALKEYLASDLAARLEELDLSYNALDKKETAAIASPLDAHPRITLLNLKGNHTGRGGAEELAKV